MSAVILIPIKTFNSPGNYIKHVAAVFVQGEYASLYNLGSLKRSSRQELLDKAHPVFQRALDAAEHKGIRPVLFNEEMIDLLPSGWEIDLELAELIQLCK